MIESIRIQFVQSVCYLMEHGYFLVMNLLVRDYLYGLFIQNKHSMQIKQRLFDHCQQYVNQRLDTVTRALEEVRQATNEETKSSAGDKHETGRAMMQLEQEKLVQQLGEVQQLQQVLDRIQLEDLPLGIGEGRLVMTGLGNYFIAISAGKLEWEGRRYYLVSLASPIGVALANHKAGETISFREQSISILEVH